jgi:membrane-associated phospholipid phosphatase
VNAPAARWQDTAERIGRQVGVPMTAVLVALTLVSIGAGVLVTGALASSIGRDDLDLARELAADRHPTLTSITGAATVLADSVNVAVLWVGAMALAAWRTRSWAIPVFLLVAIGGEKLTYLVTSVVVGRPRPPVPALGVVHATTSFPSGHVGSAIVLYGGLVVAVAWHRRRRDRPLSPPVVATLGAGVALVAGLVGFSRLYRGHHYLSDVVWGVLLGVTWLAVAWALVLRPLTARGRSSSRPRGWPATG